MIYFKKNVFALNNIRFYVKKKKKTILYIFSIYNIINKLDTFI